MQIKRAIFASVPLWVGFLFLLALAPAEAMLPRKERQLPDFDKRSQALQKKPGENQGFRKLKSNLPSAEVDWDPILGTPHWVRSKDGFLTGKNGEGRGVSKAAADRVDRTDPDRGLKAFLNEHSALFGHDASPLSNARKSREFVTAHNGMRTVVWQQEFEKIPVFEALLISHSAKDGELVSISSHLLADLPAAAKRGMPNRPAARLLPAETAVVLATATLEQRLTEADVKPLQAANLTSPGESVYSAPGLKGETHVKRVWFPLDGQTMRLCWEVLLTSRKEGETFRVLIDTETGQAWLRQCLTHYISPATYRVFTGASPSPFSPGYSSPSSVQPPLVERTLVTTNAVSLAASPAGWINDGDNETRGNNVDAHLDRDGDNVPELPRPQGSPARVFDFPLDLTKAPGASSNAAVVQVFYWCNWMHDKLYDLGFTEAAGNFQSSNFGRGGVENDPVQADAQDGSDFNNANMTTLSDGSPPRLQLYLFNGPEPDRDGALDVELLLHEYTHGLSNRRVGGGIGLTASQSIGLGEGWSDFYALSLLSKPDDDVDANYPLGGYSTYLRGGMDENYYFGTRRYPYSTDMTKAPLTLRDIDPSQATGHPGVPVSPVFGGIAASEVHGQGEVWCSALWDARANLIRKLGHSAGNQLMLQLVTDALNLTPGNPTFIQARDAILQADRINYGGTNQTELWMGFAKRGLGFSASCPSSSTTLGVQEAFDLPDELVVSPVTSFVSSGPGGGPFSPAVLTYSLSNLGSNSLSWTVINTNTWLTISDTAGTIVAGSPPVSLNGFVNSSAAGMADGIYSGFLVFTHQGSAGFLTKQVTLSVGQSDYFTEVFDVYDNDVHNQTLTFVPNGSVSFYSVCREPAASFPVDPRLGKPVALIDDSFAQITLAGTNKVSLYGKATNVFFIGSNGYISFDAGDSAYSGSLAAHFGLRRVSGFFSDLNPKAGGRISWQQLGDRAVITFENVPEYSSGAPNSFQMELFYDGRVRLTHLNVGAENGLIGLSRGGGIPPAFLESDLTAYPSCLLPLTVSVPTSVPEGAGLLQAAGTVLLPGPASSNVTINLRSSDPSEIQLPSAIVIPAGQTQGQFNIQVVDDAGLDGTQFSLITASASGFFSGTAAIAIIDNEAATLSLNMPGQVPENGTSTTVTLNVSAATATAVPVTLVSSDPQRLQVPSKAIIPAGATSVTFAATIVDNQMIDGNKQVQITAQVPGWSTGTGSVLVVDDETNALFLVYPNQTSEASGLVNAKVVLSGTVSTNQTVFLESAVPGDLQVPSSLTIPAGHREFAFQMPVTDNSAVDGNRAVSISVRAPGWFGQTSSITILDDDTPAEPFRPFPPNLASNIPVTTRLSWNSGEGELMVNGDFESGTFEGWTMENTGTGAFAMNDGSLDPESPDGPLPPASGNYNALSNPSGSGRHVLYQDLFIPPSASTVMLRWDQRIRNHGSGFGSNQQFRAEIRNPSNEVLQVAYASTPGEPLLGNWSSYSYDLSDFRGTSVRIAFVEEDSTAFLNAHIDNVSVIADSATPLSYEVYFGTSPDSGGEFLGTTMDTFWDLPGLSPLTTYYWHVISRGIGESSGPTWRFTTRGLDHFSWDSLQATQRVSQPFMATLSARDEAGSLVTNFQGSVHLEVRSVASDGSVIAPVGVTPLVLGGFTNGVWSGSISVLDAASQIRLTVSDEQNHKGTSGVVSMVEPNDLSISVTASVSPVIAGTEIIYTIVGYNSGPSTATDVVLLTSLPYTAYLGGLEISQGACTVSGQYVTCEVGDLEADSSVVLKVYMNAGAERPISTVVWASRLDSDANDANNSAYVTTDVLPARFVSVLRAPANEDEGQMLFTIQLDEASTVPVTISFSTTDGTATAGQDYVATNGTITFPPGTTQAVVPVRILEDLRNEPTENFYFALVAVTNALADDGYVEATILDKDPQPTVSALDGLVRAPAFGVTNIFIPVVLSQPSGYQVEADFTTSDGTALAGTDYFATNGTVIFPPGVTNLSVALSVFSSFPEVTNRVLHLALNNAVHANLGRTTADGIIVGRNSPPVVNIANASITEGGTGKTDASFSVTLSFPSSTNIPVSFQTQGGTATPGIDYDSLAGTILFLPGQVTKTITVPVRGDLMDEEDETFSVILFGITNAIPGVTNATGSILNDDPHPALFFANATVNSLSSMDTELLLPVRLGAASGRTVTLGFKTRDGSALAGTDYGATNGTLQFPPGATNALLRLNILKERSFEPDEVFYVDFLNPNNAVLTTPSAVVTITHGANGIGTLDHFQWSTIPSPQFANYPFTATLSARDAQDQIIQDFQSPVTLKALIPEAAVEIGSGRIPIVFPLGNFYQDSRSQILYLSSELGKARMFSALSLELVTASGQVLSNCVIRLKHTGSSSNPSWQGTGWQTVFQGGATLSGSGWLTFPFYEPFAYDGTNHLLVDLTFNNAGSGLDTQCFARETAQPRSLYYRSDNSNGIPLNWTGNVPQGFASTLVPNLRLVPAPVSLSLSPSVVTQWNSGSYTGQLAIASLGTNVQIQAEAEDGHSGWSNPFDVRPSGDLQLSIIGAPPSVDLNSFLVLHFLVRNSGTEIRTGVVLTNQLDPAMTFVSSTSSQGACSRNGQIVRCDLGSLAAGQTVSVDVQVLSPSTITTLSSTARVVQNELDVDLSNNSTTVIIPVNNLPPLVSLSSPASGSVYQVGFPINLSATASDSVGIQRVDFFADGSKLGQAIQAPYVFGWNNAAVGAHMMQAIAYDSTGLAATSSPVTILVQGGNYSIYKPPGGSWAYLYNGDAAQAGARGAPVLDGTWDYNNPSSQWDSLGRGPGVGNPGGISTDGNILTIEDAVGTASGANNNRNLLFTHGLKDPGVTNSSRILDEGITLTFRARLTPGTISPAAEINLPNGYGIFNGGKGNFGVRQAGQPGVDGAGLISFSLVRRVEESETNGPIVFASSGLAMNRLNGEHPTNDVDSASRARLSFLWSLPPGSRPYLTSGNSERTIAYNPVTGHLLLVSRAAAAGGLQIPILNAINGTEVGKLSTNGISGGSSVLNGIGVGEDGAIYAANVVSFNNSSNSAFRIYRWAYESATPTLAFSGEILNGQRWGDTLDVRGSGADTQILVGSGSGTNKAAVFVTSNGINFTPVLLDATGGASNGDFRTALAFGPGNTFYARQLNGPLLEMTFDLSTQKAGLSRSFAAGAFSPSITSISVERNLHLMAGVTPAITSTNTAYVELFDLDSLVAGQSNSSMDRQNFSLANANPLGVSSVQIAGGKLFALDSNNGLLACDVTMLPGTPNILPLDPTVFHEFWITIQGNVGTPGNGTHTVSVYADGSLTPFVFHVTAGTGADLSGTSPASTNFTTALATNYLSLGCPSSLATGAIDIDYFGYKPGIFVPAVFNAAPVLSTITDRVIHGGTSLVITNQASDPDATGGPLIFSLDAAPAGALLGSGTGVFTWTAPDSQAPGTNLVTIRVTDSGSPPLSDTKSFKIIVLGRPKVTTTSLQGGTVQLSWSAIPGQRYRVVFKNDLNETDWQTLPGDVVASGGTVVKSDASVASGQRFYRILVVQ